MVNIDNIKNIVIIGAGTLGKGIAQVFLLAGFEKVILNDLNMDILRNSAEEIRRNLDLLTSINKLKKMIEEYSYSKILFQGFNLEELLKDEERLGELARGIPLEELIDRLILEDDLEKAVSNADYVVESAFEDMNIKQELFKKLDQFCPKDTVLATNSSSLSISKIAKNCGRPEKVIGMHFFSPYVMKLVEITKGEKSSNDSVEIGEKIGKRLPCFLGKRVVITLEKESPGFIGNRVMATSYIYISRIIDDAAKKGIKWEKLDADFNSMIPIGLCEYIDQIGIDVIIDVFRYLENALSPEFKPGKVLTELYEKGELGRKTCKGFYEWKEDGTLKHPLNKSEPSGILNIDLMLAIQLNEGCRILEEGIVKNYRLIDKAMLNGYGTPGPFMSGRRKHKEWVKLLEDYSTQSGIDYLKPCELMKSGDFYNFR